ncbi:MAG: GNAT family N-acetyltransferase [Candidatus Zixiibacteriota bacterium]|nr:MAG: GNAT family N-acetyltransferase [candidate division Zixibacteria bacterium]
MVTYTESVDGVGEEALKGFFVGWPSPPSARTHLKILENSAFVVIARDEDSGDVVGFVNAISDGVLTAYVPLLEVRPAYQRQGIGSELMRRLMSRVTDFYMVDLLCDKDLQPFYGRFGMTPAIGMMVRNFERQSGE